MTAISLGSHNPFITLVRLGIGHIADPITSPVRWNEIEALAITHGLSAIVLDGIEKLPELQRPPKEVVLQWIGNVMQGYESRYVDYEKSIGELAGFYNKHGIKMMVLKGYGLSLFYPNPKHRPCGDIDTWNFGKQEEADAVMTKELCIKVDKSEHHHTVFDWHGYMVENHYDMLITSAVKTNKKLEPILKELAMDDSKSILINGVKVFLPSANFNALFLLRHMLMHFVACGINIRNILDWGFFWEKQGKEVDINWLKGILEKYKMDLFFNIINAICVDNLGFESYIFPSVQFNPELKEKVFIDTLSPDFDWTEAHRLSFFPRLVFKYNRWKSGAWKRDICYGENEWTSFWTSLRSHLEKPSSI